MRLDDAKAEMTLSHANSFNARDSSRLEMMEAPLDSDEFQQKPGFFQKIQAKRATQGLDRCKRVQGWSESLIGPF